MVNSRTRKSVGESYISESYRSVIVKPYQASLRMCFCCKITRAPLIIIVICLIMELARSIVFAYLTYIPGMFTMHFLANSIIMLVSFALFGQALLIKSQKLTGFLVKIYSIARMYLCF